MRLESLLAAALDEMEIRDNVIIELYNIIKVFLLIRSYLTILEVKSIVTIRKNGGIDVKGNLILNCHDIGLVILNCLLFYLYSWVNTLILSSLKA